MLLPILNLAVAVIAATSKEPTVGDYTFHDGYRHKLVLPMTTDAPGTVVVDTYSNSLLVSYDFGLNWKSLDNVPNVQNIYGSENDPAKVTAICRDAIYMSFDGAHTFTKLESPLEVTSAPFDHPTNKDWIILNGKLCDKGGKGNDCVMSSFVSKDRGQTWQKLLDDIRRCYFVAEDEEASKSQPDATHIAPDLVYCETINDAGDFVIYYSQNMFANGERKILANLSGLSQVLQDGQFVVAAFDDNNNQRDLAVSRDGINFNRARYPPLLPRSTKSGVNIIDNMDSLLIFEAEHPNDGFGTLLHSGINGFEFTTVLEKVNRPVTRGGFVDIQRLKSVDGVLLANIVANPEDVRGKNEAPIVKSVISHSDGAKWASMIGPNGGELHLHGFTDRISNERFSMPSALGIYIARGNEGSNLGNLISSSTYLTRDAGLTWSKISNHSTIWAIGGSGSIIVMAEVGYAVDKLQYSRDEGLTWSEYSWGYPATIWSIDTDKSGASQLFLLMLIPQESRSYHAFSIDLSGEPVCLPQDLEEWSPEHPQLGTKCLLGREIAYKRRIRGHSCLLSDTIGHREIRKCQCTREDYECDFTHRLESNDGACKPIDNKPPPTMEEQCRNGAIAWLSITGYRKLAASSCEGEFLDTTKRFACPGKEKQFNEGEDNGAGNANPEEPHMEEPPTEEPPSGGPPESDPPIDQDRHRGFFSFIFFKFVTFVVKLGLLLGCGFLAYTFRQQIIQFFQSNTGIRLPEDGDEYMHNITNWWNMARSYMPFLGMQIPHDHLGFYSRMNDDARYNNLQEDYEDESDAEIDSADLHSQTDNEDFTGTITSDGRSGAASSSAGSESAGTAGSTHEEV